MALSKNYLPALRGERVAILEGWKTRLEENFPHLASPHLSRHGNATQAGTATLDFLILCEKTRVTEKREPPSGDEIAVLAGECVQLWSELTLTRHDLTEMMMLLKSEIVAGLKRRECEREALLQTHCLFIEMSAFMTQRQVSTCEQEVNALREEYAASHHIANRFLANSSHELRTPLTAVLGFSELLLEGTYGDLTEVQTPIVGHIENSAKNLLEIINNLLDVLNIRAGKLKLKRQPVMLHEVITQICDILKPLAVRKQVSLQCLAENTGIVSADENILRHIFYYLLSSSLRASTSGSTVSITNKKLKDTVEIIVEDSALHLPVEAIKELREPFPLIENSPVRGYDGWEVGLPLSLRYVEMHNGQIAIESKPERGTRFTISLPITSPAIV